MNATRASQMPHRVGLASSYRTLLRWRLMQIGGTVLPMIVIVQSLLAAGLIVGFGFVIPDVDADAALLLATGTPTALLLIVGLVMLPSAVADARADGTLHYLRALPIPRSVPLLVELSVWLTVALPSVIAALAVAQVRFDLDLSIDWSLLGLTTILVTTTAMTIGYAIAVTVPPIVAQMITQALVFFVLLFSPITFPAERLPSWLATLHDLLPIRAAADLMRSGLARDLHWSGRDLLVLAAWCGAGSLLSLRALARRQ